MQTGVNKTLLLSLALVIGTISAAARAADAVDWSHATSVDVMMSSYAFNPETLKLKAGMAYRLRFVNSAGKSHNFASRDFFSTIAVSPADRAKIQDGEVDVDGGETVTIDIVPQKTGSYDVRCTEPFHAMFGMHGKVVVE